MRAELKAAASQPSVLASSMRSTSALRLVVSSATLMPSCASHGASVWFSRSSSCGACSRSSGSWRERMGTTSSSSASTATISVTSISSTAKGRGTRRCAIASTAGCSA